MAIAITGAHVWNGLDAQASPEPLTIRVEHDRIAAIGSAESLKTDAEVYSVPKGSYALPGLIDCHVHMTLDPAIASPGDQARVPRDKRACLRCAATTS